jgi:hypothetical protein
MKAAEVLARVVCLSPKKRKVDAEVLKGAAQVVKWRVWRHDLDRTKQPLTATSKPKSPPKASTGLGSKATAQYH